MNPVAVIDHNPAAALRTPRSPQNRPRPLTEREVARVLDAATGRQRAWILLALYAGLRAHEIAKIRGEDVTETALYVCGKGGDLATLPTSSVVWDLAADQSERGWWFPSPRSASGHVASTSVTTITTRFFRELGISGSIHRCRHTYGTRLLRTGANIRVVQELMRHASLATTAAYTAYTAVGDAERSAAIASLGDAA